MIVLRCLFVRIAGSMALLLIPSAALAQAADDATRLPEISMQGQEGSGGSLTAPSLEQIRQNLAKTPGAVAVIDADSYKRATHSLTIKEALDYTPGFFTQARWGTAGDFRLSIRDSGLSRNYRLRSLQLYMDGVPINTADNYDNFLVIDPSVFLLIEVYKGANALRSGSNSLGGAVNFVTPSGRDADASLAQVGVDVGSFGYVRTQASSGGTYGKADYFITGAWQRFDGFRDHSIKMSGNVATSSRRNGKTRFYLDAACIRQNTPGEVTRDDARNHPKRANAIHVDNDYECNVDHVRLATAGRSMRA
jgi:iron complex outermembrane receptor protein